MRLSWLLLLPVAFSFLSFTVDKRVANDQGLLNPLFLLKNAVVVWKNNIKKSQPEIWKKYLEQVRAIYGAKNATLIKPVSKMALDIYSQLPTRLKSTTDGILAGFRNGTYKFQPNVVNQLIPKIFLSVQSSELLQFLKIKNIIEKQFIPLAGKVFFNPFDQEKNEGLEGKDFDEIGLFTGK